MKNDEKKSEKIKLENQLQTKFFIMEWRQFIMKNDEKKNEKIKFEKQFQTKVGT